MVQPDRAFAVEHRPREIEGSGRSSIGLQRRHHLGNIRIGPFRRIGFRHHDGREIAGGLSLQHLHNGRHRAWGDKGNVALKIDHHVVTPIRIQRRQRRHDTVRAGGQVRIGQDRRPTRKANRLNDLRITLRHRNRTHAGRFGLAQHPDDHRQPFDVREGLPRQACGGHTRRN